MPMVRSHFIVPAWLVFVWMDRDRSAIGCKEQSASGQPFSSPGVSRNTC